MVFKSTQDALLFLEKHGQLVRVTEEVDPELEMAAIHLRVYAKQGPALWFTNVKGSKYSTASNIFGTLDRARLLFEETLPKVETLIQIKDNPVKILKKPFSHLSAGMAALTALPTKKGASSMNFEEIKISDLPQIKHWPDDGGAFVTLPQVYTEDADKPGIMNANVGMYRIQLSGNEYEQDEEIGLHYQLHRGIGVHQQKAMQKGESLKVSIFVGGPPAHSVAAVMPLPEGMSEATFAGLLGNRRFRYAYNDGYCISLDADFVITGEVKKDLLKPEGPFGDHLGYYSLKHLFPVLKVHKVYAKKDAIWPFTVVGRPPQEDTSFGALIHSMTGDALQKEIPGLKEVNAVDAAGVHPLLLAIGSERYTPYAPTKQPAEILTIANHVLGKGQLSLAKFLWITADDENKVSTGDIAAYFQFVLERIVWQRDVHFYTNTSIDTLDYSGTSINMGSKVVLAAYGAVCRTLCDKLPDLFHQLPQFSAPKLVMPGVIALHTTNFTNYDFARDQMETLDAVLKPFMKGLGGVALIIITDDPSFLAKELNNFLWVTFTRSNPAKDIYGIQSFTEDKHWGCHGPLVIDAREKPHHAPVLKVNAATERSIQHIFDKGGSLFGI